VRKVDVFICGVQKGGTTSLFSYFCEHPRLVPPRDKDRPRVKEPHFFDNEDLDWSSPDYRQLHELYPETA
jgi:hypothetical protein